MRERWQLKKFIPIYLKRSSIIIGFEDDVLKHVAFDFSKENYTILESCVKGEIVESELKGPVIKILYDNDFLEPVSNHVETNRNNLFLSYLSGIKPSLSIQQTKILIFGAGAGGGTLSYLLAQFGFTNITVIDFDTVEESDVYRVMVYDEQDIGQLKIDALKKKIKKNFNVDIQTDNTKSFSFSEVESIIKQYQPDFIVMACDPDLSFRESLNTACFRNSISYIIMAYSFEELKIGPMYIPGFTACDMDFDKMLQNAYKDEASFKDYKRLFRDHLIHPSVSFNINILANLILKEIVLFLYKQYEFCISIGRLVSFNPLVLRYKYWDITRQDGCPICSKITF